MMQPEWMPLIMEGAFCEVLVFDAATLHLLYLNESACRNLRYDNTAHSDVVLPTVIGGIPQIETTLQQLQNGSGRLAIHATLVRRDGSCYPAELRLMYCAAGPAPVYIAIAKDVSDRHESAEALRSSEARSQVIFDSTPGLFFQLLQKQNGSIAFPYLSDGCHALLGIDADTLRAQPDLFVACILREDQHAYLQTMRESAAGMTGWNWEGRLRIEEWNDIKWVNLRATPRQLENGDVQWEGIMTNITQSKHGQAEVERSRAQLAELSAHVEQVKEEERKRIAREIHDDLGGNLTAIKMALALLARRLPEEQPGLADKAAYLDQLVDRTIDTVHRIAGNLRPSVLDIGIVDAIQWQAKEFERQMAIPCVVRSNVADIDLSTDQSTALFRIFQEALTNVGKHAAATHVDVWLAASGTEIRLEVADNGKGLAPQQQFRPKSFGMLGMTERANALGGSLAFYNAPTGGCVVAITIPLSAHPKPNRF
jgi:two-component system sensor histidine kinase UhpB